MSIALFCTVLIGAIVLDLMIGDPRWLPHPVIGIGKLVHKLERAWNQGRYRKTKGIFLATAVIGSVYMMSWGVLKLCLMVHPIFAVLAEIGLLSTTIAIKGLKDAALQVAKPLGAGDIVEARQKLSWIVGRDTAEMGEREIVRGTVETVAENTVDGITAPIFWFCIGGVPAALAYRAVNTLDSMVGYKNERYSQFGWASARIDDLANWIPARLTAFCMGLTSLLRSQFRSRTRQAFHIVLRDAPKHPSPNSGWPEAMTAGLLGVALGGRNVYQGVVSIRAKMGDETRQLEQADIHQTISIMHGGWLGCTALFMMVYCGITWLLIAYF